MEDAAAEMADMPPSNIRVVKSIFDKAIRCDNAASFAHAVVTAVFSYDEVMGKTVSGRKGTEKLCEIKVEAIYSKFLLTLFFFLF